MLKMCLCFIHQRRASGDLFVIILKPSELKEPSPAGEASMQHTFSGRKAHAHTQTNHRKNKQKPAVRLVFGLYISKIRHRNGA